MQTTNTQTKKKWVAPPYVLIVSQNGKAAHGFARVALAFVSFLSQA